MRKTLIGSGLYLESDLRRGNPAGPMNIKSFLMQIRNAFSRLGKDSTIVTKAIDDLEALQLETLSSQLNRHNSISWALPFLDTSPVWLQLYEKRIKDMDLTAEVIVVGIQRFRWTSVLVFFQ